jgi:hypothetical protein
MASEEKLAAQLYQQNRRQQAAGHLRKACRILRRLTRHYDEFSLGKTGQRYKQHLNFLKRLIEESSS